MLKVVLASKPLLLLSNLFCSCYANLKGILFANVYTETILSCLNTSCFLLGFTPIFAVHIFEALSSLKYGRVIGTQGLVHMAVAWKFSLIIFTITSLASNSSSRTLAKDTTRCPFPNPESQLPLLQIHSLY